MKIFLKFLTATLFVAVFTAPSNIAHAVDSPAVTYSQTFTGGQTTPTAAGTAWTAFKNALTGTYTSFTASSTYGNFSITVSDPTKVQALANAMHSSTTLAGQTIGLYTWVYTAGSQEEFGNSGNWGCASGANVFIIRPFINNANWGGAAGNTCNGLTQTMSLTFGTLIPQLTTPSAPRVTGLNGNSVLVSETSTTANASSYVINIYASNGTTFIESQTVTSSNITNPTTLGGLTPLTTYTVGVVAVGDGANYINSNSSPLTTITMTASPTTISIALSSGGSTVTYRQVSSIVATLTGANGKITFSANGKKIPNCTNISSSALSGTCSYRASFHGGVIVSARLVPNSSSFLPSNSQNLQIISAPRSGNR